MLKEQKGITLVALIITIIVMLILAGVSISLVVGDNGVLTQAQGVEPKQVQAALKEAVALANADIMSTYYGDTTSGKTNSIQILGRDVSIENSILKKINDNYSYSEKNKITLKEANVTLPSDTAAGSNSATFTLVIEGLEEKYKEITVKVICEKVIKDGGTVTGVLYNISAQ